MKNLALNFKLLLAINIFKSNIISKTILFELSPKLIKNFTSISPSKDYLIFPIPTRSSLSYLLKKKDYKV